jgi:hypothetical protein
MVGRCHQLEQSIANYFSTGCTYTIANEWWNEVGISDEDI